MIVEKFTQNFLNTGLFRLYIATGFFASLIFFTLNADYFTAMEMIIGIMGVTIFLKAISNIMLSMIVSLFSLDNKREEIEFKYNEERITSLLNELNVQEIANTNEKVAKA